MALLPFDLQERPTQNGQKARGWNVGARRPSTRTCAVKAWCRWLALRGESNGGVCIATHMQGHVQICSKALDYYCIFFCKARMGTKWGNIYLLGNTIFPHWSNISSLKPFYLQQYLWSDASVRTSRTTSANRRKSEAYAAGPSKWRQPARRRTLLRRARPGRVPSQTWGERTTSA